MMSVENHDDSGPTLAPPDLSGEGGTQELLEGLRRYVRLETERLRMRRSRDWRWRLRACFFVPLMVISHTPSFEAAVGSIGSHMIAEDSVLG